MSIGEPDLTIKPISGVYKLPKKQRIAHLESALERATDEIAALRARIEALEARPISPYPWQPLPDPIYPVPGPYMLVSDDIIAEHSKAWKDLAGQ